MKCKSENISIFVVQLYFLIPSNASTVDMQITVMGSEYEPFVYHGNKTKSVLPKGLDISILDNFAKTFDLTIEYSPTNVSLREIFESEDKHKNFIDSLETKIDVFVGGLEENLVTRKYLVASQFYHYDYITWCVSKSKSVPFLERLMKACRDPWVFIIFTIQTVLLLGAGYTLQIFERPPLWDWNKILVAGLALFLGIPITYNPKHCGHRIVFLFALLGSMVFVATFLALFLNSLTGTFPAKQIQSISEILNGKYILAGDGYAFMKLLQQNETYPLETLKKYQFCDDLNICLDELKWNSKLAVAISHARIESSLLLLTQIYCFDNMESVHKYYLRFLVKKRFRYLNKLNEFIHIARSSGMVSHWTNINRMKQHFLNDKDKEDDIPKVNIVIGFWPVFVMLYFAALLTFFFEKIIYRKVRNVKPGKFWIIFEKVVDPDRHFLLQDPRRDLRAPS